MDRYYSNGKLLISGEYLVLFGARAFALPTRFGQSLEVFTVPGTGRLHWETSMLGRFWFTMDLNLESLKVLNTTDISTAKKLGRILKHARELNPDFLLESTGYVVRSDINFNIYWGLGSSSSLISNIAYSARVDPFVLNKWISKGSGYDIACARSHGPLVYWLENEMPYYIEFSFNPDFSNHLYFVYLGEKQDTDHSINEFLKNYHPTTGQLERISGITEKLRQASSLEEFNEGIREHERIMSGILNRTPVKDQIFPDFKGDIKSLGAWGGDFILVSSLEPEESIVEYFKKKDLYTIFPFSDLVLSDGPV